MNLVEKSNNYLSSVRRNEDLSSIKSDISECDDASDIEEGNRSKAFWCNIYNARVQELINKNDYNLESTRDRFSLLYKDRLEVFGRSLSLQRIEHEVLRKGELSFGLGYLPNPRTYLSSIPGSPGQLDYRIHFLLNCGAVSCPLIRPIQPDDFDEVAEMAADQYISEETVVNEDTVRVPRIFLWYIGDFGGIKGVKSTVKRHTDVEFSNKRLRFKQYKWINSDNPYLDNTG